MESLEKKLEKKYNTYGLLITVASLLMVISYAGGEYDGWDIIIALFSCVFGVSFLKHKMPIDWFSSYVASFIAFSSASTIVFAVLQILNWFNATPWLEKKVFGFDAEIYFVAIISLLISIKFKPKTESEAIDLPATVKT